MPTKHLTQTKPMKNNIHQTSIYHEKLAFVLRSKIQKQIDRMQNDREIKYHHHTLNGLVSTLTKIVAYSYTKPHYRISGENRFLEGYHIYGSDLATLKKNKLSQYFSFFSRADNSTYHANNAKSSEKNGYAHWYVYSDLIFQSIQLAEYLAIRKIKYAERFERYEGAHQAKIVSAFDTECNGDGDYIKVRKRGYLKLYKWFQEGRCDDFLNLLYNSVGSDNEYVYIRNDVISEHLDGSGRQYTRLGTLSKSIRQLILRGYTEVDMDSAIQTVLVNLYYYNTIKSRTETSLADFKKDFPAHYELLSDKKRFRRKIAAAFKCDEKAAKQILTSISYAPKRRHIFKNCKERTYIHPVTGREMEFSDKQIVECKKLIEPLIKETIKIRKVVLEKFYYREKDQNDFMKLGNIRISQFKSLIDDDIAAHNLKLEGKGRGKPLEDRRIYRLYELVENQVRTKMIEFLNKLGINEHYQLHDCLIFPAKFDLRALRHYIFKELNLNLSFSAETY